MQNREMQRDKQVAQMLFTLKIMFMLFSMFPVFEKAFGDRKSGTLTQVKPSLMGILILVAAVGVLGDFLFSTFAEFKKRRVVLLLELSLFFALYILTLWMSGLHTSNYKFLFLFVIIYYTIAHSKQMGFLVAAGGSALVLGLDLFTGNSQDVNVYFQQDLALVVSFFVVAQCLGLFVRVQREYAAYLEECARMDGLTGVYNHRSFHQLLEAAYAASVATGAPLSVIMMDIDFFKKYNDLYGHQQGDEVLRSIAAEVGAHLRPEQTLARYGGEEFAVILPGLAMQEAQKVAEEIHRAVGELPVTGEEVMPFGRLTISLGLASLDAADSGYEALLNRADAALYRAKYLRRDTIEIYSSAIDKYNHENGGSPCSEESLNSLKTLIGIINSRDSYTYNHVERVVYYCEIFADYLKLPAEEKRRLLYAAYLHDLGKINIPKEVLIKPTALSEEEWGLFRQHCEIGYDTISRISELRDIAPIVLQHHERMDGTGYPNRLRGGEILYPARMLAIADSFDAMTNERPYNKRKTFKEAFVEVRCCAGTQFDPDLAEQFIAAMQEASSPSHIAS